MGRTLAVALLAGPRAVRTLSIFTALVGLPWAYYVIGDPGVARQVVLNLASLATRGSHCDSMSVRQRLRGKLPVAVIEASDVSGTASRRVAREAAG